ncbi:MAG TPA: response regulator transcription factor [Gaiellaceae bacterium]|nr:response regulator transcription factor [Gaiellaceae bacterium]
MSVAPSPAGEVVVADDHPPVLQFLSRFLAGEGWTVVASTRDGEEALQRILETQPAVAVLDVRMPGRSGLDVVRALAEAGSTTRVVLYTGHGDLAVLDEALDLGVAGIVNKDSPLDDLVRAIRVAAAGGSYVDPGLGALRLQRREVVQLTRREREVLTLLAEGLNYEGIGERLSISPETVRTHVQKAMARLGASTRTQAVAAALRASLIH